MHRACQLHMAVKAAHVFPGTPTILHQNDPVLKTEHQMSVLSVVYHEATIHCLQGGRQLMFSTHSESDSLGQLAGESLID